MCANQADWRYCHKCHMMFFDGYPEKGSCPAGGGHDSTSSYNYVLPHDISGTETMQTDWRYCHKCHAMFFDGYPEKGSCPADGPEAYNFVLPYDISETSTVQMGWRYCHKCLSMFFDGYPEKGSCPAGGGHDSTSSYNYVLLHDISGTSTAQTDWRYCQKCHSMFFDGYPDKDSCPAGGGHDSTGSYNYVLLHDISETSPMQMGWRYCHKCLSMFFDAGYPDKGSCPAGGGHDSTGSYNYVLPYDIPGTSTAQMGWRYCHKCLSMFFDGYPEKGSCPAGGGHDSTGSYNYVLPYDIPGTPTAQMGWRYCHKCLSMFFDGYPEKGSCPDGGGHDSTSSYNYVLPHDIPGTSPVQIGWRYCHKCHMMFFDGYPEKGSCPDGGGHDSTGPANRGHEAAGYNFSLPHDISGTETTQTDWRYCQKCHSMFFDGYPDKGSCPAGGGHEAAGYNFVLPIESPEQKINEKYAQLGGRFSPLGRPVDPNLPVQFDGKQFFRDYRGGRIEFSNADGVSAHQTFATTVRFRGIHCFGKSEAVDEPYAIVGVYSPDDHDSIVTKKFPIGRDSYENFVASTDASESIDVRTMATPQDIAILCTVMEHDLGDPDRVAAQVEDALKKAASDSGVVDAADIKVFTGVLDDLQIPNLIASLLGVGDDLIGSQTMQIHYTELEPGPTMQQFGNISFNFESPLLSDGDASYKIYFEVFTSVVNPSIRL